MNLTQIEAAYTVNLNEKLTRCFENIEKAMVEHFREVESSKDISMRETYINGYSSAFDTNYKADIVKQIKARYAENWNISYALDKKGKAGNFLFHYKGKPVGSAAHIVHRETIIVDEEPVPDRTQILDLRE